MKFLTKYGCRKSFQQQSACFVTTSHACVAEFVCRQRPKLSHCHTFFMWSNMIQNGTPSSTDRSRKELGGASAVKANLVPHVTFPDIGPPRRLFYFLNEKCHFCHENSLRWPEMASQMAAETPSSRDASSGPRTAVLHAPQHLVHTRCLPLSVCTTHTRQDLGYWSHVVLRV